MRLNPVRVINVANRKIAIFALKLILTSLSSCFIVRSHTIYTQRVHQRFPKKALLLTNPIFFSGIREYSRLEDSWHQSSNARSRVWNSSARSFPQRGTSLRILLRSSLLSVEKPCPLSRPRASSPISFALGKERRKMKKNCDVLVILFWFSFAFLAMPGNGQETVGIFEQPILITSAGQKE